MITCDCINWCRTDIKFKDGKPLPMTNHHPRCSRVDESLIDVWRVTYDGASLILDDEPLTEELPEGATVEKVKMHREIFNATPEFAGW